MYLPHTAAFDFETTAPPNDDARDPERARPVSFSLVLLTPPPPPAPHVDPPAGYGTLAAPTGGLLLEQRGRGDFTGHINPGCPVSAASSDVHGITDADVADAPAEADAIAEITQLLAQCAIQGYALCAANAHYDLTVLDRRARAHDITPLTAVLDHYRTRAHVIDPMVIDRYADGYRSGKRTLTDLCDFYRVPLTEAHTADADALAAALVTDRITDVAAHLVDALPPHHPEPDTIRAIAEQVTTPDRFATLHHMSRGQLYDAQVRWRATWAQGFQQWLRTKAPADRRDPGAVVDGSWPLLPLP